MIWDYFKQKQTIKRLTDELTFIRTKHRELDESFDDPFCFSKTRIIKHVKLAQERLKTDKVEIIMSPQIAISFKRAFFEELYYGADRKMYLLGIAKVTLDPEIEGYYIRRVQK